MRNRAAADRESAEPLQTVKRFLAREATRLDIILVYLFGSRAQGRPGPISDYDFAVLLRKEPAMRDRCALIHRLALLLETDRVDLVVLNRAPVELQYSTIVTGCLLYEASRVERVEFEARTLSRYFDYLPILRRQREELLREEEEGHETGVQRHRAALRKTQSVLAQARTAQEQREA